MKSYAVGIDIGTSSVKTVLADDALHPIRQTRKAIKSSFPFPGWVEQDAEEICLLVLESINEILTASGISERKIVGIGLDHQGESCLIWNKNTGKPVYPVITWQDRRTAREAELIRNDHGDLIREKTSQPADSYYSAFKFRWILDHTEEDPSDLLAGTLNSYIIWRMSSGRNFIIDPASAVCTLLFDPRGDDWDPDLLRIFGIPREMLPEIVPSIGFPPVFSDMGIPILATSPDSHAGMFGIGGVRANDLITTYGTGNFMHLVTGPRFFGAQSGLTNTILFSSPSERIFQLNGICYTAGSAVKWLIDGLGMIGSEKEASDLAKSVENNGGVCFIPALNGFATPYWIENARGAFLGLTAGTGRAHIVRAVLESIAFQVAGANEKMKSVSGSEPPCMTALGGMTGNDFLMQFQADVLGIPVKIPSRSEPCFGAAGLVFAAKERLFRADDCPFSSETLKQYDPAMNEADRLALLSEWQAALKYQLGVAED